MSKPIKNILCYSHPEFNKIMESNGWIESPPKGISCISICSPNEEDVGDHWFINDWNITGEDHNPRVFNLDIDDLSPFWFKNHESECYDLALDLYLDEKKKQSNAYFNHVYVSGDKNQYVDLLHALDYEEAEKLTEWIDWRIKHDDTIYIHCAVGASRSQGVVRYIVDTYGRDYDIRLNPNNPNNTYNPHVVMMLKRAFLFGRFSTKVDDEIEYIKTEPIKFNHDIKLSLV